MIKSIQTILSNLLFVGILLVATNSTAQSNDEMVDYYIEVTDTLTGEIAEYYPGELLKYATIYSPDKWLTKKIDYVSPSDSLIIFKDDKDVYISEIDKVFRHGHAGIFLREGAKKGGSTVVGLGLFAGAILVASGTSPIWALPLVVGGGIVLALSGIFNRKKNKHLKPKENSHIKIKQFIIETKA